MAGYHDAHLPEDPARVVVWSAVAEHLSAHMMMAFVVE